MTDTAAAPKTEARERFERVILPRVEKAVKAVELIGNGASRDYETTPDEIAELLNDLQQKLWDVQRRYAKRLGCSVQIFDAAEGGKVEGARVKRTAPLDNDEPAPTQGGIEPNWPAALGSVMAMNHHQVPGLVAHVPTHLLSSVITQLVHRAMDRVEQSQTGRAS